MGELGVSWGLATLDRTCGLLRPGRLYVVGARPSNGKSMWSLNWLDRFTQWSISGNGTRPWRVACFLTERTGAVAVKSWCAHRLGYAEDAVLCEEWDTLPRDARNRIHEVERELLDYAMDGIIAFVPTSRPTPRAILDAVEQHRPHVVLFDFIQRVRPSGRQSKFDAVAEAAHLFQSLAVDRGLLVVVTSQLKRRGDGVFDKYHPPHLEDFKLAGEIEENADVALGLFRPLKKMTTKEERAVRQGQMDLEDFKVRNVMAIKVLKHRYRGPAADRLLRARVAGSRLEDIEGVEAPAGAGDAWEPEEVPF